MFKSIISVLIFGTLALSNVGCSQTVPVASPTIAQNPISVTVEGQGQDIILIPGLASSREVWHGLNNQLGQNYRRHLVQVAGFAGLPATTNADSQVAASTATAIANYIQQNHLKKPIVIGHSLGGEVALMLAARYPDSVSRVMVVDALPFYSLIFNPMSTSDMVKPQAAAFRDMMLAASDSQYSAMQTTAIARLAQNETVRAGLVADSLKSDRKTVANATYEIMTTDLRPELNHIKVPVRVVYAYNPSYGYSSIVDNLYKTAYATTPNISFQRIEDSSHFVMLDQPVAFSKAVTDFLNENNDK